MLTFNSERHWGPSGLQSHHKFATHSSEGHVLGPSGLQYPPDTPLCGFFNELCPTIQSGHFLLLIFMK